MKFIYPAVFHKTEKGTYKGYFPDLECCYGEGETLDDAIDSANAACCDWITLELEEGGDLPYVSDPDDLNLKEGDILRNISVNIRFNIGWDE
ncbi:MAG: type II toxin-antitoxin system HicB family antitoxin [Schaedlerella sp.]|nr:type II toxin-antitoxin system HicB family antitoxin [Schaedlerella sp.]